MGGDGRHSFRAHLQQNHHHQNDQLGHQELVPKGYFAVMVGHEDEEEQERFVVPIMYLNHPLFVRLLKEAEEEYGFEYVKGRIAIPCRVTEFREVKGMIDREKHQHNHHHHHNHHAIHAVGCFRA